MDYVYMSLGKNPIITSEFRDTGCIGNILLAPFLMPNCIAFDGVTDYEKNGKHKDLYNLYSVKCPDYILAGSDEDHFKLVNFDGRYAKGDIANAGNLGNESLPNIKGSIYNLGAIINICYGIGDAITTGAFKPSSNYGDVSNLGGTGRTSGNRQVNFDAHNSNSVYKDGAKVNPDHFTVIWQARYRIDKVATEIPCPYAVGDIYQTTSSIDPATRWAGTTWERIADGNYIQFVGESKSAKQQLSAELPNVMGDFSAWRQSQTEGGFLRQQGALYASTRIGAFGGASDGGNNSYVIGYDASRGQTSNSDGTEFVPQANSVYKNGGEVRPKSITAYGFVRLS